MAGPDYFEGFGTCRGSNLRHIDAQRMNSMKLTTTFSLIGALTLGLAGARAADSDDSKAAKPYPLTTCVVSGEKIGAHGKPVLLTQGGYEVKLCCKDCTADFQKDTAKYIAKLDKAYKDAKPYPTKTCIVTDEALGGDMGDPYVFAYDGRQMKLCCKSCLKDFDKSPEKFTKKWDQAAAKAAKAAKK
jgi:YHS domain-containing protein